MSIVIDPMKNKITLHGLGFIQVQLPGDQRIHVWHPDLPRRSCYEYSSIHDHRFGFISRVLVGEQRNIEYGYIRDDEHGSHDIYLHEGARTPSGSRPWLHDGRINVAVCKDHIIKAGDEYDVKPYQYHRTEPGGDGIVVTLMKKTFEGGIGAHSTCMVGYTPDTEFDRFQWSDQKLWQCVINSIGGFKS